MKKALFFLQLMFLIFLSKPVDGRIIHVPSDSSTIQKGINGAEAGDTVLVALGIYSTATNGEIFPINIKCGVILLSEAGAEDTWIFADYDTTVIRCLDVDSTTIIRGFRISKGNSTKGGGIYCENSSIKITDNEISYNEATKGGGIYCENSSTKIIDNGISYNKAIYGAGIYCQGGSPTMENNVVAYDSTIPDNGYGAGIYCLESSARITNNQIKDNIIRIRHYYPEGYGGGIYCENSSNVEILDNLIEGNTIFGIYMDVSRGHGYGAGICCIQCAAALITRNIIINNHIGFTHGTNYGGGIYCSLCTQSKVAYNLITENEPQGMRSDNSLAFTANNNTITSNVSYGIDCYFSNMDIYNNIITDNSNRGIKWGSGSTLGISYNDVWNNSGGNFLNCPPGVGDTTWGVNYNSTPCDSFYNISRDPLFHTHPDSLYNLQVESPCIDAGDSLSPDDPDGTIADMGAFYYDQRTEVTNEDEAIGITGFELFQNYPNPFNSVTQIRYELPKESNVQLTVYNILGQKVAILTNERQARGLKIMTWEGKDDKGREVASGIYFYRIEVGDFVETRKMLLLK